MFFFNVFLGVLSCLLRIIKAIVFGVVLIGRLDHSSLTGAFQFHDPGKYCMLFVTLYTAYVA